MSKNNKKDIIKKYPFIFCDQWCERCTLNENCLLFQKKFNQRIKHIFKGEDPDHPDIIFSDIKENVYHLVKSIEKETEKEKIGARELKIRLVQAGFEVKPNPKNFSLWQLGHQLKIEIKNLLEDLLFQEDIEIQEQLKKNQDLIEELNWYHNFFEKKLYQSLIIKELITKEKNIQFKKTKEKEMNSSAKLAIQSLKSCKKSLEQISLFYLGYVQWSKDLIIFAEVVLEKIENEFPDYSKIRTIFHG